MVPDSGHIDDQVWYKEEGPRYKWPGVELDLNFEVCFVYVPFHGAGFVERSYFNKVIYRFNRFSIILKALARKVLPLPTKGRKKETTRKASKKVPSFHLTGKEAMEYIKDADSRAKQKAEETKEMDVVKKEAVKAAKAAKSYQCQRKYHHLCRHQNLQ